MADNSKYSQSVILNDNGLSHLFRIIKNINHEIQIDGEKITTFNGYKNKTSTPNVLNIKSGAGIILSKDSYTYVPNTTITKSAFNSTSGKYYKTKLYIRTAEGFTKLNLDAVYDVNESYYTKDSVLSTDPDSFSINNAIKITSTLNTDDAVDHPACIKIVDASTGETSYVQVGSLLDFQSGYDKGETKPSYSTSDASWPNGYVKLKENNDENSISYFTLKGLEDSDNDSIDSSVPINIDGTKNGNANATEPSSGSSLVYSLNVIGGANIDNLHVTHLTVGGGTGISITDTTEASRSSANSDPQTGVENVSVVKGSINTMGGIAAAKKIMGYKVYGAVFNDYAEYRNTIDLKPGTCVVETGNGDLIPSTERLQAGGNIISDTFGFAIGETQNTQTPIAVCGRVLVYPDKNPKEFLPGEAVCTGAGGTVSAMSREEIREWPDRIVGTVSEIPTYEYWGSDHIKVDGRIWIKVR